MTASFVNVCTQQSDRQVSGSLLDLVMMLMLIWQHGRLPHMWKRDIKSAFRRLPVLAAHAAFAWIVWLSNGVRCAARHDGMPFGAVSSVVAWHRLQDSAPIHRQVSALEAAPDLDDPYAP